MARLLYVLREFQANTLLDVVQVNAAGATFNKVEGNQTNQTDCRNGWSIVVNVHPPSHPIVILMTICFYIAVTFLVILTMICFCIAVAFLVILMTICYCIALIFQ